MSAVGQHRPAKKRRTKTFTGCWTCRDRHLKCDEGRPSCKRCINASLCCSGYGMRVAWASVRSPTSFQQRQSQQQHRQPEAEEQEQQRCNQAEESPHQSQRTQQSLPPLPTQRLLPEQPKNITSRLVETSLLRSENVGSVTHLSGPGSGFRLEVTEPALEQEPDQQNEEDEELAINLVNHPSQCEATDVQLVTPESTSSCSPFTQLARSWQNFDASLLDRFTSAARVQYPTNQSQHHGSPDDNNIDFWGFAPSDEASNLSDEKNMVRTSVVASSIPRYLDLLPDLPLQRQLLEHWCVNLADLLIPIPTLDNPFRYIVVPIAYQGAMAPPGSSSPSMAVFHLLCSASASHLARLKGQNHFLELSLRHHHLGMQHLRQHVSNNDSGEYITLLAAFCMCLLNETLTVGTPFWRFHIRGACAWFRQIPPSVWSESVPQFTLYQLLFGLILMVHLQLYGAAGEPLDNSILEFHDPNGFYCIDQLYGLSRPTLEALLKIINIKHCRDAENPATEVELDVLEMEVYLSSPPVPLRASALTPETTSMMYHHGYAFYYSCIIYYKRSVRSVPVADVQTSVAKALDHFEAMMSATSKKISPAVWPIAIVAFEAQESSLQMRIQKLLDHTLESTKFEVWMNLKTLTRNIWDARQRHDVDEDVTNMSWERYFKENEDDSILLA